SLRTTSAGSVRCCQFFKQSSRPISAPESEPLSCSTGGIRPERAALLDGLDGFWIPVVSRCTLSPHHPRMSEGNISFSDSGRSFRSTANRYFRPFLVWAGPGRARGGLCYKARMEERLRRNQPIRTFAGRGRHPRSEDFPSTL